MLSLSLLRLVSGQLGGLDWSVSAKAEIVACLVRPSRKGSRQNEKLTTGLRNVLVQGPDSPRASPAAPNTCPKRTGAYPLTLALSNAAETPSNSPFLPRPSRYGKHLAKALFVYVDRHQQRVAHRRIIRVLFINRRAAELTEERLPANSIEGHSTIELQWLL